MNFTPLCRSTSESSIEVVFGDRIDLGTHHQVMAFSTTLLAQPFPGLLDVVPAYASVTVFFDPLKVCSPLAPTLSPARTVLSFLKEKLQSTNHQSTSHQSTSNQSTSNQSTNPPVTNPPTTIPTYYDGSDLSEVAERLRLPESEVVRLHSETVYTVFMIGFLPGFPYLGVLPEVLQLPRRDTPRLRVPAGAVAIAGAQTGIYPQASPGGWHLIGRTDFPLFDVALQSPARLQPGMRVKFVPI